MSRDPLPEECGADLRPDPPTLADLEAVHDWRIEERGEDGRYLVDVCEQCGYEERAGGRSRTPDCRVREIPPRWRALALRRGFVEPTNAERIERRTARAEGRDRSLAAFVASTTVADTGESPSEASDAARTISEAR